MRQQFDMDDVEDIEDVEELEETPPTTTAPQVTTLPPPPAAVQSSSSGGLDPIVAARLSRARGSVAKRGIRARCDREERNREHALHGIHWRRVRSTAGSIA